MAQLVKNPPAMQETQVQSLGWEDSLEKGKDTHSRTVRFLTMWGRGSAPITPTSFKGELYFDKTKALFKSHFDQRSNQRCFSVLGCYHPV